MALLGACDSGREIFDCDKERIGAAESGDGKFTATVLQVQCGATTRDATWVLVSPHGGSIDEDNDIAAVFEGKDIRVEWIDGVLEITYGDATIFKEERSLHGIAIRYVRRD